MAKLLDLFEEKVEPHVPTAVAEEFKGQIRAKMNALAVDSCNVIDASPGDEINGYTVELRDQLELSSNGHR